MDLFTTRGRHLGERGFRRSTDDDRDAAATAGLTILVTTFLVGLVVARGWPTPPGGCGACRDGGGAVASWAS
jgi:hypothetical protein